MWFTTWDLKNFYWALKGPIIRFATLSKDNQLQIWRLDCVPFGWDKACYLGQTVHLNLLQQVPKPQDVDSDVYIDDGLAMGPDPYLLTKYTSKVTQKLKDEGFPISEKSHLIAEESQKYIGKLYQDALIQNTPERLAKLDAVCYYLHSSLPLTTLFGEAFGHFYLCC